MMVWALRVVAAEVVGAEVVARRVPDQVGVVGVVLGVVELDEEGRPLHAVVVLLAALDTACPRECDIPGSGSGGCTFGFIIPYY